MPGEAKPTLVFKDPDPKEDRFIINFTRTSSEDFLSPPEADYKVCGFAVQLDYLAVLLLDEGTGKEAWAEVQNVDLHEKPYPTMNIIEYMVMTAAKLYSCTLWMDAKEPWIIYPSGEIKILCKNGTRIASYLDIKEDAHGILP